MERFITISRRAMACNFRLQFPGYDLQAIESGYRALDIVENLERRLTIFHEGSEVARVNRLAFSAPVEVSKPLARLIALSERMARETGGAFDATRGGYRNLELKGNQVRYLARCLTLNFGAVGKGFAIDCALGAIRNPSVLMEGGGSSTRVRGRWPVALGRHRIWLKDQALGTSANDRQMHIVDPRTGRWANAVRSASAIAPTAAEADALSTAFFVMGVERTREYCQKHVENAAFLIGNDGKTHVLGACEVEVNE